MRPKIGVIGAGIMGTSHGKSIHFCQKMGVIDCDFVALGVAYGKCEDHPGGSYCAPKSTTTCTEPPVYNCGTNAGGMPLL